VPPEVTWGDYDWFERLDDLARRCAVTGEFAVLLLTDLLEPDESGRWIAKFQVVDAKRPNARGEVPRGGAY
jgi:hypothetical protein